MSQKYDEIVKDCPLTGIMYLSIYTKWEEQGGSSKVVVSTRNDSKLPQEIYEHLSQYLVFLTDYSQENIDRDMEPYGGIIIYTIDVSVYN